ncbi:nucleolar protein 53 [Kwoniella heveanensis CBS 569]|nr:nucleolar protein 53 [Kwoniella heveanensis CBS 569]
MAPATSSRSASASSKPYDRPSKKGKGKGKAPAVPELGAPATLGQSSRKGKKAWRKNIDIRQEEEALEKGREEERVTGGPVAAKSNGDLFTVDVVGDEEVAKKARRAHKPLRSLAVLQERSAVPSLTSRTTSSSSSSSSKKPKVHISAAEQERLRRIARKTTAHSDGTGLTSADVKANDPSSAHDVWVEQQVVVPTGGFGEETLVKKSIKVPETLRRQREIYLSSQVEGGSALETPEAGVSYNPSAESHAQLITQAVQEEMGLLQKEAQVEAQVEVLGGVIEARRNAGPSEFAEGMKVGPGEIDGEGSDSDAGEGGLPAKKQSKRKTQAQRNKALRAKMAEQAAKAEKEKRKLANSVSSVAAFKKELERKAREEKEKERIAKLAKKEKERLGLQGGEKIGKHKLSKKRVEVQLGEDLAESLRQVKPEGNLFKDRFLALQKRALIEPRVPVQPKRRTLKTKEYEKHAYKRFQ